MTQPGGADGTEPTVDAVTDESLTDETVTAVGAEEAPAAEAAENSQVVELTEALQRERAQFVNFRRRSAEEFAQAAASGRQKLVDKLLPILDDLDRAREHGDLVDGPLKAFADKLGDVLAGEQLVKFGEPGDTFDPELHEAIQNDATGAELVLGQVYRSGYRLGDKVIRHAMVTVTDPAPEGGDAPTAGGA